MGLGLLALGFWVKSKPDPQITRDHGGHDGHVAITAIKGLAKATPT